MNAYGCVDMKIMKVDCRKEKKGKIVKTKARIIIKKQKHLQ